MKVKLDLAMLTLNKNTSFCLLFPDPDSEHKANWAEMVIEPKGPGWKDFKDTVRFLDEEEETLVVKEGDEMTREEKGRRNTGRSRTSSGSTRLRFVFKLT